MSPEKKPVTTLIKQTLGDKVEHPEFSVNTVAIIETAAEKWVALTRRVASSRYRKHYRDPNLVRHLYDLYKINEKNTLSTKFKNLVSRIVNDDRTRYQKHNDDYFRDPASEIKRAVDVLGEAPEWRDSWNAFIDTMVFSQSKLSFDDALGNVKQLTLLALGEADKKAPAAGAMH